MKVSWSQKLLYQDGQFCLSLPFSFPAYVIPVGKKTIKREKIVLNLNPGTGTQVLLRSSSHRLQVCLINRFAPVKRPKTITQITISFHLPGTYAAGWEIRFLIRSTSFIMV